MVRREFDAELLALRAEIVLVNLGAVLGLDMLLHELVAKLLWAVLDRALRLRVRQLGLRSHLYCLVKQGLLGLFRLQAEILRCGPGLEQRALLEVRGECGWLLLELDTELSGNDPICSFLGSLGWRGVSCVPAIFSAVLRWSAHASPLLRRLHAILFDIHIPILATSSCLR